MTQNLLSQETSPYLLQHKDNPVNWLPWGKTAFDRARREDKPVMLSVGYAACHWCHVMAHESFEDIETAELLNAYFISIKVDREERPDIDRIYMQSLHALGEHGGWPLTMFLTPEAEPFWGGTYFPKETRYGRPSFKHVLSEISRTWRKERNKIATNSAALVQALRRDAEGVRSANDLSDSILTAAAQALLRAIDTERGGLQGAPKFPQGPLFNFLWTMARRNSDRTFAGAVRTTLSNICQGGIYDHLGGGIARYSTDPVWLVPHFEKMLYDNAQFVALLARVWPTCHEPLFRTRIEETIAFVLRDMRVSSGAFAASYDADSEGQEGRYYVWTFDEINAALPADDAALFARAYGVTPSGNWEGKTILNRLGDLSPLSDADETRLHQARSLLLAVRQGRVPPGFDDKVLADWNGLMIAALADAALVFARKDWADAAQDAFSAVLGHLWTGGRLRHSWRNKETRYEATADGYANLIAAALALSPAFPAANHTEWAMRLLNAMVTHHWDEDRRAFCLSAADASMVIVRPAYGQDDATPNANGVMVENLVKLYHLTGDAGYLARARSILNAFSAEAVSNPFGYTTLMRSFAIMSDPIQIVMTAEPQDSFSNDLFRTAINRLGPDCIIQSVRGTDRLPPDHPAHYKTAVDRRRLFLCRGQVCAAPAENAAQVHDALELLGLAENAQGQR